LTARIDVTTKLSQFSTHRMAYAGLAALFLVTLAAFARDTADNVDLLRHGDKYARPPFYLGDANWGAVALQSEAEAAGMKFADTVLTVDGRAVDGFFAYYSLLRQLKPGDRLRVQVQTPGSATNRVRELEIGLQAYRSSSEPAAPLSDYAELALRLVLSLICIALGFWVAAARISDPSAWLLLVVLLSFVGGTDTERTFSHEGALQPFFVGFAVLRGSLRMPALMLFGIAFPERLPFDRRYPWVKWIVAGYQVLVAVLLAVGVGWWMYRLDWAQRWISPPIQLLTGVEGDFGGFVDGVALVICAGALGWKAFAAPSRDARRRLMLFFLGATPAVVALLIGIVAQRLEYTPAGWPLLVLGLMVLAFPLTTAYVIVVHRAMDVRVAIRQGLQYLLARGGVRVFQIALLVAATIAATTLLTVNTEFWQLALVVGGLVAVAIASRRFSDRLGRWVDRRFFREAYEADAILSDLATRVRTIVETQPLLETVATRIAESLHVPRIAILLDDGGAFRPAYALGYGEAPAVAIPPDGVTVARLRRQQHAVVRFDDQDSWVQMAADDERRSLEVLKPELLLPLSLNEKVLGIMSLGLKQSEEPYSKTDIRLLDSVAAQTGLALENGRLTDGRGGGGGRPGEAGARHRDRARRAAAAAAAGVSADCRARLRGHVPRRPRCRRGLLRLRPAVGDAARRCDRRRLGQGHPRRAPDGVASRVSPRGPDNSSPGRSDGGHAPSERPRLRELRREPLCHVLLWRTGSDVARVHLCERRPQSSDALPAVRRRRRGPAARDRRSGDRLDRGL
jgi:sigma-B regulation protein RsbU (phosphoserine phosphatase)